jgi:adenosine kinase
VLGGGPVLVAAVGRDFEDYGAWLANRGVDVSQVLVSPTAHTARFICTTDQEQNQIASFYPGAMAEAAQLDIMSISQRLGGLDLVLVGPDDPAAMSRHTRSCRAAGIKFVADPSQQLPRLDGEATRDLIDGAAYLFNNEYESQLIEQRTGWTESEILSRVGVRVTTLGKRGSRIQSVDGLDLHVPVAQEKIIKDPTGVGDAFRAGFLMGLSWGVTLQRCAQVGSLLAALAIETVGTQEFEVDRAGFARRFTDAYGELAASDIAAHLAA